MSYTDPPLSDYLDAFYSPQGGIELNYLRDVEFVLDECTGCGLVYQRSIPDKFLMRKLYEEWIDPGKVFTGRVKTRGPAYYTRLAREIERILQHFGTVPSELEFLDFGMGWGEWCRMARAYGCSATGTELSRARIEYAKTQGLPTIRWDEIRGHRFDVINTEQVFEHIADPLETLDCLCKALAPGGIVKIGVPDGTDIKRRLAIMDWTAPKGSPNSLNPVAPLEHINCFSHDSLVKMAAMAGLEVVQLHTAAAARNTLLDISLRDILRPCYCLLTTVRHRRSVHPIRLFFQRSIV